MDKMVAGGMAGVVSGLIVGLISTVLYILDFCRISMVAIGGGIFMREMMVQKGFLWLLTSWAANITLSMALGVTLVYLLVLTGEKYALLKGAMFGAVVWYLLIGVIAPLGGYMPPVVRALEPILMLAYHLLFGVLTAWWIIRWGVLKQSTL
jgi:hypothetical protein